jgi:hypothetical protein
MSGESDDFSMKVDNDKRQITDQNTSFDSIDSDSDIIEIVDDLDDATVSIEFIENKDFVEIPIQDTSDLNFNLNEESSIEVTEPIIEPLAIAEAQISAKRVSKPSLKLLEIQDAKDNPIVKKKPYKKRQKVESFLYENESIFHSSVPTVSREIIQKDIRLESYNAISQAKKIYGIEIFNKLIERTSTCGLCGFMFKDRISYQHNIFHKKLDKNALTITYDHFLPVNFSALTFRIPIAKGVYSNEEMRIFKLNGHMTCYHCNSEKSQRMFVTCPKKEGVVDFNNFAPKEESIRAFFKDLIDSNLKMGLAEDSVTKTLDICLKDLDKNEWIEQRVGIIKKQAQLVCEEIKKSVDVEKVKKRIQMTKGIIQKADNLLLKDSVFLSLYPKSKYRYRREYIAKLFGDAELKFPNPWKTSTKKGGSSRRRKNKRKTYRRLRLF